MKGNELVWRALADRASAQRTWRNVADLAYEAGVPSTTASSRRAPLGATGPSIGTAAAGSRSSASTSC
jgi:hypothetical protein